MIMDRIHEKSQAAIDRCRNGAQRDPRVSEDVAIQAPAPSGTRRCSVKDNWLKNLELDSKLQKERVEATKAATRKPFTMTAGTGLVKMRVDAWEELVMQMEASMAQINATIERARQQARAYAAGKEERLLARRLRAQQNGDNGGEGGDSGPSESFVLGSTRIYDKEELGEETANKLLKFVKWKPGGDAVALRCGISCIRKAEETRLDVVVVALIDDGVDGAPGDVIMALSIQAPTGVSPAACCGTKKVAIFEPQNKGVAFASEQKDPLFSLVLDIVTEEQFAESARRREAEQKFAKVAGGGGGGGAVAVTAVEERAASLVEGLSLREPDGTMTPLPPPVNGSILAPQSELQASTQTVGSVLTTGHDSFAYTGGTEGEDGSAAVGAGTGGGTGSGGAGGRAGSHTCSCGEGRKGGGEDDDVDEATADIIAIEEEKEKMLSESDRQALMTLAYQLRAGNYLRSDLVKCMAESLLLEFIRIVGATGRAVGRAPKSLGARGVVYVLGRTGAGKSTLLAYLLGYAIKRKIAEGQGTKKRVYDYETTPMILHPVIGHLQSQTKGCHVFSTSLAAEQQAMQEDAAASEGFSFSAAGVSTDANASAGAGGTSNGRATNRFAKLEFVDCAGTVDTGGTEQDICNAVSLSLAMSARPPTGILVVLSSSDIINDRGVTFLDLIKRLSQCIRSDEFEDAWSGFVFVVNDRIPLRTDDGDLIEDAHEHLLDHILDVAKTEQQELEKLVKIHLRDFQEEYLNLLTQRLEAYSLASPGPSPSTSPRMSPRESLKPTASTALVGRISGLPADVRIKLETFEFKIRFLRWLPRSAGSLVIASIGDSGDTRRRITRMLRDRRRMLLPHSFVPEHLYGETVTDPRGAVDELINGVVDLVSSKIRKLDGEVEMLNRLVADRRNRSAAFEGGSGAVEADLGQRVADRQRELDVIDAEVERLRGDHSRVLLATIRADVPIVARTWLGVGLLATRYTFSFRSPPMANDDPAGPPLQTPILAVEEMVGSNAPGDNAAAFLNRALSETDGSYSSQYLPAYYGHQADINTSVNIYVRNCHHPYTQSALRDLRAKREPIAAAQRDAQAELQGFRGAVGALASQHAAAMQALGADIIVHSDAASAILAELYSLRSVGRIIADTLASLSSDSALGLSSAESATQATAKAVFRQFMAQLKCPPEGFRCLGGHPMWATDKLVPLSSEAVGTSAAGEGGGAGAGVRDSWRCRLCSRDQAGERWVCVKCSEEVCLSCRKAI